MLKPLRSIHQSSQQTIKSTMTSTIINPTLFSSPNPKNLVFTERLIYYITPLPPTRINRASLMPRTTLQVLKCSNDSEQRDVGSSLKDVLSGMVDERVELLLNKEENRVLLDGLEKATQRVESAKRELAEIQKQEIEAKQLRNYINQLESRASEIAESQREILEARAMIEEAERSLDVDGAGDRDALTETESEEIDKNEERWESVKAASVSAIVGTLAGLPISFTQVTSSSQLILPLAITFVSCALYGVTFRYAIRRDLDNVHLKTGTSAAFGFVKGLATLDGGPPLELDSGSFLSHAFDGAVFLSQNLLIFLFASVALDFCYKMRIVSPFPIQKSVSRTNIR